MLVSVPEFNKTLMLKRLFFFFTCTCQINYTFMKSLIDDSPITCDEIIDIAAKLYSNMSEIMSINSDHKNM